LSETLNLSAHAKIGRTMVHPHFTFKKRLSHTADSQDQRHRATPASRPILATHVAPESPDFATPVLVEAVPAAKVFYEETMAVLWRDFASLLNAGAPAEFAIYLLPNAVNVRFEESGDLAAFHHKWVHRLCYTAQEEIWRACREEWLQVKDVAPCLARHIAAPCTLRQPFCPEGDRYCGVPVWKLGVEDYKRLL
jgi:thymidylate synthase ThyX